MGRGQTIMLWLMIAVALGAAGVTFVMRGALGDSAQIRRHWTMITALCQAAGNGSGYISVRYAWWHHHRCGG